MKIKQGVTIYRCDYCNKPYFKRHFCEKHELVCYKNSINDRDCYNCKGLDKVPVVVTFDSYGREDERTVNILYCKKKNIGVYPPNVEQKRNAFEVPYYRDEEIENKPMPKRGLCSEREPFLDWDGEEL